MAGVTTHDGHANSSHRAPGARCTLFHLGGINLGARALSRADLERSNPHRHEMALLDWVVWHAPDFTRGVGLKIIGHDEFWVRGHFPGRPMFPGVLMIETAAQLAAFLYNSRFTEPRLPVFTHINEASFRSAVRPGDELYILCRDVKFTPKRFISDVQGLVGNRVAFDARIAGIELRGA